MTPEEKRNGEIDRIRERHEDNELERQESARYQKHCREVLSAKLDMLKAKGVQKYVDQEFTVEFSAPADDTKPAPVAADPDLCRCGHPLFAHAAGLCLIGCNAEKCVDADTIP